MLDTYAQTNMLWWVSATALVGAMLAAVWARRDELRGSAMAHWLFFGGSVFLTSIVVFGGLSIWTGIRLRSAALSACADVESCDGALDLAVFDIIPWGVGVGTTSFVIALIGWLVLGRSLLHRSS